MRVIIGENDAHRRLPVDIPKGKGKQALYPFGHGLKK